ncbi:DUF2806 domain-containing protein [Synechococcus elongatus]|uniref:DUF2806 domain-containing protein n=1 Tax=Synechococcus elongatus PCC 11802 TaxID=2283154 RepID=A0AAT9JXS0_SYNEL|nr:DUF2806 domain-containing protein [Synechococcus elongatus]QFZ92983.1 DUF2806 domain-containing protein [Synechococcus elongatus PCC 11802]
MQMPGERLLERMWETITEKGIGRLLKPWQMRRESRATIDIQREEILILAQAQHDAERIRRGEVRLADTSAMRLVAPSDEDLSIAPEVYDRLALPMCAMESMIADMVRREVNTARAVLQAEAVLEEDPQVPPDQNVDEDWLFRWRDSASQVSNDLLQSLWGRVLAGEVKSPGSFSLRTLDFLKNLTQKEAEKIARLSRFIVINTIFRGAEKILEDEGIDIEFLLKMQELGIISGVDSVGLITQLKSMRESDFFCVMRSNSIVLLIKHNDPQKVFTLPTYHVTSMGKEIFRLGVFEPHIEYLEEVGKHIKSQGFTVEIASYYRVDNDRISPYNNRVI